MSGSVRLGRKRRALALAGGFACSIGAFAQESAQTLDPRPASLARVVETLERMEEEQGALRQEIEALQVERAELLTRGLDVEESESVMDPTSPLETRAGSQIQGAPLEIMRIHEALARLEAEQEVLRQAVESLWARWHGSSIQDAEGLAAESGEVSRLELELVSEAFGGLAAEGEAPALALDEEEGAPPPAGGSAPHDGEASVAPDEALVFSLKSHEPSAELYEQGREAFRNLNFYGAAKAFQQFLNKYPTHEDVGEARYWLGEALYAEGRFQEAIGAFAKIIADAISSRREVARLKTGYAWFELGDFEKAESILVEVRDQNPGSDLARLAQLRLDRMRSRAGSER